MDIICLDALGRVGLSADIDDWQAIAAAGIDVVIDLDGDLDRGVPTVPNQLLYIYFPIDDAALPDLDKLHALAQLSAALVDQGHKVLAHCALGCNRSALMVGLILVHLGMNGDEAVSLLRFKRTGALFNPIFASYLSSVANLPQVHMR